MPEPEAKDPLLVKSIRMERFRGVREGTVDDLGQINLLVGRNNSGKTTVLEALLLLSEQVGLEYTHDPLGRRRTQLV